MPLKKRHYHISTVPLPSAEPSASPKSSPDASQEATKPSTSKSVITNSTDKSGDKGHAMSTKSSSSGVKVVSTPSANKQDIHRNSVDEVIEATITRYSHESRSVIVTPKKRHRLEMEKKGSGGSPVVRNLSANKEAGSVGSPQPTKRVSSRSSSTGINNQSQPRTVSPSPTPSQTKRSTSRGTKQEPQPAPRQRSSSRGAVTEPTVAEPEQPAVKRANTRSRLTSSVDKLNGASPAVTSATQAVLNKRAAKEKAAEANPAEPEPEKPNLQHVGMLSTRSASKILPNTPLITPIPPPLENSSKSQRLRSNKPPAGVFEPSSTAEELISLVSIHSPAMNHIDAVLNQKVESIEHIPNQILKLDESHNGRNRPKRLNDSSSGDDEKKKKRKVIRDIRVQITKLSPSDLVLKKVMGVVKTKIRKRGRINRTGFPVKKKKKKKLLEIVPTFLLENDLGLIKEEDIKTKLSEESKLKLSEEIKTKLTEDVKPKLSDGSKNKLLEKIENKTKSISEENDKPKPPETNGLQEPILCVHKVDEIKVETKEKVGGATSKTKTSKAEKSVDSEPLGQRSKKSDDVKPQSTRLLRKSEISKADLKVNNKTDNLNDEKSDKAKVEVRKSSRRLMMLKARQRVEASKRRKRKENANVSQIGDIIPRDKRSPSPDLPPSSPMEMHPPERMLPLKRLRKTKEDLEKDDR